MFTQKKKKKMKKKKKKKKKKKDNKEDRTKLTISYTFVFHTYLCISRKSPKLFLDGQVAASILEDAVNDIILNEVIKVMVNDAICTSTAITLNIQKYMTCQR